MSQIETMETMNSHSDLQIDKDTVHDMLLYHIYVYGVDIDTTFLQLRVEPGDGDGDAENGAPAIYPFQFYKEGDPVLAMAGAKDAPARRVFWPVRDYLETYCCTCVRCGIRYSAYPDPFLTVMNVERKESTRSFCLECVNSLHVLECALCGKLPECEPWEPVFLHDMCGQSNTLHCRRCDERLNSPTLWNEEEHEHTSAHRITSAQC